MEKTQILIVDDHPVVLSGLRGILARRPDFEVCGEATTGRVAVAACAELAPDIVIMDILMPDVNGLDAARQIKQAHPQTEVLILSVHESEQLVRGCLAAGARGYMLKTDAADSLLAAVDALREHKLFFNSQVSEQMMRGFLSGDSCPDVERGSRLSTRERQIVQLLAEGRSNKETAATLNISIKTIETHRARIMKKLDFRSVSDLVRYAIRNHIIEG